MPKSLLKLLIFIISVLGLGMIVLQNPTVQKIVLIWGIEKILDEPEHKIEIPEIQGTFPYLLTIPHLTIKDAKGEWLCLEHLQLKISWIPFSVDFIRLKSLDVKRKATFQSVTLDLKKFLFSTIGQKTLKEFDIQSIHINQDIAGNDFSGSFRFYPHPAHGQNIELKTVMGTLSAHIDLKETSGIVIKNLLFPWKEWIFQGDIETDVVDNGLKTVWQIRAQNKKDGYILPLKALVCFDGKKSHFQTSGFIDISSLGSIKNIFGDRLDWAMSGEYNTYQWILKDVNFKTDSVQLKGQTQKDLLTKATQGLFEFSCPDVGSKNRRIFQMNLEETSTKLKLSLTEKNNQTKGEGTWDFDAQNLSLNFNTKNLKIKDSFLSSLDFKLFVDHNLTGSAVLTTGSGTLEGISFHKMDVKTHFEQGKGTYILNVDPTAEGWPLLIQSKGNFDFSPFTTAQVQGNLLIKTVIARSKKKSGRLAKKELILDSHFKGSMDGLEWQTVYQPHTASPLNIEGKISLEEGKIVPTSLCNIKAQGLLNLSALTPWLTNGDRISGKLETNVRLTGTWATPHLQGNFKVHKGFYEIAEFGTCIGNTTLDMEAQGSKFKIQKLWADDGTNRPSPQGQLVGEGTLDLKNPLMPVFDVNLSLTDFQVAASDIFFACADGKITVKGPLTQAKIEGYAHLNPAKLSIEEINSESTVPTIKLTDTVSKKDPSSLKSDLKIFPIHLHLKTSKRFMIEGFGLESLWDGEMEVIGYLSDTQLIGVVHVVKGKLDLFGKPMKIIKGEIRYDETIKNDPYLSAMAVREADGITIQLVIEGRVSRPQFTFLSVPALPQEDILSRLLFGKELNQISVGQSLQLAAALASINGQKGLNITDKIRTSFGLDSLELKENKNEMDGRTSQAVSIGKEFGNVRISIDQAITTGTSKASVSTALSPHLNLDVDIGGSESSGVGLSWIKRY